MWAWGSTRRAEQPQSARLQRGASIGFIPLKWSFSKDPARPLGLDFHAIKLLEWSICALPCNQDCILIGSVSGATTSSPSDSKMAALRREARALAAKARSLSRSISDPVPLTRDQRVAEAQALRRPWPVENELRPTLIARNAPPSLGKKCAGHPARTHFEAKT
jgi:hypothetical protein